MGNQFLWHWPTFFLYVFMGLLMMIGCYYSVKVTNRRNQDIRINNPTMLFVGVVWLLFAVYRLINDQVGGKDAPGYIADFNNCLNPSFEETYDFAFIALNRIIRWFTDNYHIYFYILYSLYIISFYFFIKRLFPKYSSVIPLCILFYLYLRGFTSIRSNLAISYLLISIGFLVKDQYLKSSIFAILTAFTHLSSVIYLPILPFIYFLRNKSIPIWTIAIAIIVAIGVGTMVQNTVLAGSFAFLESFGSGAYLSYASKSLESSFLDSYFVINLPQMGLFAMLIMFKKDIDRYTRNLTTEQAYKINILRLMAYFDVIMVPVTYTLGVYRGYEYLMLPRLIMWGVLIVVLKNKFKTIPSIVMNIGFILFFVVWMYGRLKAMAETSNLVFYSFDL